MAGFDLFYLFVENIFGNWWIATLGMLALFVVFGMLSRMSTTLLITLGALWIVGSMIGFVGIGGVFYIALFAIYYFTSSMIKYFMGLGG